MDARSKTQGKQVEESLRDIIIFANAVAGSGRGKAIAARIGDALAVAGYVARLVLEPPQSVPAEVLRGTAPARCVIVIGGDGTLRLVAQQMLRAFGPEQMPPLLVVPLGTANLMAAHLHIEWHEATAPADILAAIEAMNVVWLDAATANGQLFLLTAGAGVDGQVIHELDRRRIGPIDMTSYAMPLAMAMQHYHYPPVRVEVDGAAVFGPEPGMVFIANVPEYGLGFPILPQAKSDDGLLDVCVLPCANGGELLDLLLAAASGEHLQMEGVAYRAGRHIRVTADDPIPLQIDGEAGGFTPLEVELLTYRVPFIVPRRKFE